MSNEINRCIIVRALSVPDIGSLDPPSVIEKKEVVKRPISPSSSEVETTSSDSDSLDSTGSVYDSNIYRLLLPREIYEAYEAYERSLKDLDRQAMLRGLERMMKTGTEYLPQSPGQMYDDGFYWHSQLPDAYL